MPQYARSIILAIFSLITALGTSEAMAQTMPEVRIAIVDYQLIRKNSTAMVDIRSQIEKRRLVYLDEVSSQELELRASNQKLVSQRSVLAEEAFALKRREFEAKVAQVQRLVQDSKRELYEAEKYGEKQAS